MWICVLGGCCAVDALLLSSARDSDRAQQVVKKEIQILFWRRREDFHLLAPIQLLNRAERN